MSPSRAVWLLFVFVACTKANPAATCKNGTCIDPAHPYCDADGAISGDPGACIAVSCTPGSVGACEGSNAALICNAAGNGYDQKPCAIGCDATNLTCTMKCTTHSQCASGICKDDGTCATDSEIAFTDPAGDPMSDCTRLAPCSLEHSLSLTPEYIELAAGTYQINGPLIVAGTRAFVGRGATSTTITSVNLGPIIEVDANADVTVDSVLIANARGSTSQPTSDGYGLDCPDTPAATRSLHVLRSVLRNNGSGGNGGALVASACQVDLEQSTFDANADGPNITGTAVVDRCSFTNSPGAGITLVGTFSITNSFSTHNGVGFVVMNPASAPLVAFNTMVDNTNAGIECVVDAGYAAIAAANNIIARNGSNIASSGSGCSFPNTIVSTTVTALHFASPDTEPYDYHLLPGSTAIDAATGTSVDHDYDGDVRPKGAASDIGADEAM